MRFRGSIDNKRRFTKPNGDEVLDFTQQKYRPSNGFIIDYVRITDEFAMRPDLIAKYEYRDITMTDMVLKQNGISNPFSIDINDVLFFQEKGSITAQVQEGKKEDLRKQVRSQYIDPSKAPEIDDNLKKFDERQKPKKAKKSNPPLPPNFANFGDKEIKLRGGKVIFGEDVTANKEVCEEKPLAKSELLKRLAKNRLNKNTK